MSNKKIGNLISKFIKLLAPFLTKLYEIVNVN